MGAVSLQCFSSQYSGLTMKQKLTIGRQIRRSGPLGRIIWGRILIESLASNSKEFFALLGSLGMSQAMAMHDMMAYRKLRPAGRNINNIENEALGLMVQLKISFDIAEECCRIANKGKIVTWAKVNSLYEAAHRKPHIKLGCRNKVVAIKLAQKDDMVVGRVVFYGKKGKQVSLSACKSKSCKEIAIQIGGGRVVKNPKLQDIVKALSAILP